MDQTMREANSIEWPVYPLPGPQDEMWRYCSPTHPDVTYIGYGGPRGGGKSFGMRSWFVTACWNWPIQAVIIRRTRKDLQNNHINPFKAEFQQFLDAGLIKYSERHNEAKFKNGSILSFEFCAKNDDLQRIQGQAYDLMGLEESTQFNEHQINVMISSCRASNIASKHDTDFPNKVLMTFNWGGQSHAYHRRLFWDKEYEPTEDPSDYHFIFAPMESNTVLMEKTPEYKKQLRKLPKQLQEAWIDGNPDAFTGSMFNIVDDFHTVDPDEFLEPHGGIVPERWKLFGSLDAGTADPCSFGLYFKTPGGFIYKIFTYYIEDRNPVDHIEAIVDKVLSCPYTDGRKPAYILADRHAFQKRGKNQIIAHDVTWQDLFRDHGFYLKRANDDRIQGSMALQYALHYKYDYEKDSLIRKPKLMFFRGNGRVDNSDTIKELMGLKRDENNPEDIDKNAKDHAYDETRYAVMGAISPMEYQKEEEVKKNPHADYGRDRDIEEMMDMMSGGGKKDWEDWF